MHPCNSRNKPISVNKVRDYWEPQPLHYSLRMIGHLKRTSNKTHHDHPTMHILQHITQLLILQQRPFDVLKETQVGELPCARLHHFASYFNL